MTVVLSIYTDTPLSQGFLLPAGVGCLWMASAHKPKFARLRTYFTNSATYHPFLHFHNRISLPCTIILKQYDVKFFSKMAWMLLTLVVWKSWGPGSGNRAWDFQHTQHISTIPRFQIAQHTAKVT